MEQLERLTGSEALVLGGLLRILIREDGRFTDAERGALALVATSVALVEDDAVSAPPDGAAPIGEEGLYIFIERAGEVFKDDIGVRTAALDITRPSARAAIHALLFEVAASDMISEGEGTLLDWLAEKWELEAPRDLPGEATDAG